MKKISRSAMIGTFLACLCIFAMAADREDYAITWLRVKNIKKLGSNSAITFDDPVTFSDDVTFSGAQVMDGDLTLEEGTILRNDIPGDLEVISSNASSTLAKFIFDTSVLTGSIGDNSLYEIIGRAPDSTSNATDYAFIQLKIIDETATSEDGAIVMGVTSNGTDVTLGTWLLAGLTLDKPLITDTINEKTSVAGVTIDGLVITNNGITGSGIVVIDTINEYTAANGVVIDGVTNKDSIVYATGGLNADTLGEITAASGVTIDGVTNVDSKVYATGGLNADTIGEITAASGVTIDGVTNLDSKVYATGGLNADTISELTVNAGVTIDSVQLTNGTVWATGFNADGTNGYTGTLVVLTSVSSSNTLVITDGIITGIL